MEITWLVPTALEGLGLAFALGVCGFRYESSIREKKPFIKVLDEEKWLKWLVASGVLFALGVCLTGAGWWIKVASIILVILLASLTWNVPKEKSNYRSDVQHNTARKLSVIGLVSRIFVGAISFVILGWVLYIGWHAVHLMSISQRLEKSITYLSLDDDLPVIYSAAHDIKAIHQGMQPLLPLFTALERLPRIGPYLRQVEPVVIFADSIAQAGMEVIAGLSPLFDNNRLEQNNLTLLEKLCQVTESGSEHFTKASQAINQASQMRDRINPELLPEAIHSQFLYLDDHFTLVMQGIETLQLVPQLLGTQGPVNYLILAQNRDELRATGGFISGIGLLSIEGGKIQQLSIDDSYQIDDFSKEYPKPPDALHQFMLADYWVTRDANWSPDFPTSAQQAQYLYTLSTGIKTQGVIAFNQLAIQKILEIIGPVHVQGPTQLITADNVEEFMRQAWASTPDQGLSNEWWSHRKDFMQGLGNAMIERLLASEHQDIMMGLLRSIFDLLDQGQLLVYLNNPTAQAALEVAGWDMVVNPVNSDYLYLVDSNVGFNKVDSVIERSVSYEVDLTNLSKPVGEVTVTYHHQGTGEIACKQEISYGNGTYQDMQQRCYLDYWRIYTPGGTKLLESTAQPVEPNLLLNGKGWSGEVLSSAGEGNTQIYAGLLMLPISQSTPITIIYDLPNDVIRSVDKGLFEYSLLVQIQPGLGALPTQLELKLPVNSDLQNPGEDWVLADQNTWFWQGVLHSSMLVNFFVSVN